MNCYIRADIVIIQNDEIILIIECKSRKSESEPNKKGRQYKKYKALGVPFLYCMTFKQVPYIINNIIEFTQKSLPTQT